MWMLETSVEQSLFRSFNNNSITIVHWSQTQNFMSQSLRILCHRLNSRYGRFQTEGKIVDDLNSWRLVTRFVHVCRCLVDLVSSFSVMLGWQKVVANWQERLNYTKVDMLRLTFGSHFCYVTCVAWLILKSSQKLQSPMQRNNRAFPVNTHAPMRNVRAENKCRAFAQNYRFAAMPRGTLVLQNASGWPLK